jgi:hypothetical protein
MSMIVKLAAPNLQYSEGWAAKVASPVSLAFECGQLAAVKYAYLF